MYIHISKQTPPPKAAKVSGPTAALIGGMSKKTAASSVSAASFKHEPKKVIEDMDGKTFIILKDSLQDNIQKQIAILNSPTRGIIGKLEKAEQTLLEKSGNNGDLNHSSVELIAEATAIVDVLKKADEDLEPAKKAQLIEIQDIYKAQLALVETLFAKVDDNLSALRKKCSIQGGKSRTSYQLDYQKIRRCKNELVSGGHAAGFGKLVAPFASAMLSGALDVATCGEIITNPMAPDAFDQLFELLGDEVVVVNDETLVGLALQKDRLEKARK